MYLDIYCINIVFIIKYTIDELKLFIIYIENINQKLELLLFITFSE